MKRIKSLLTLALLASSTVSNASDDYFELGYAGHTSKFYNNTYHLKVSKDVVDVLVNELDLPLGHDRVDHARTSRSGPHSSTLRELSIYGYLNRIQASHRLERKSRRDLELIRQNFTAKTRRV